MCVYPPPSPLRGPLYCVRFSAVDMAGWFFDIEGVCSLFPFQSDEEVRSCSILLIQQPLPIVSAIVVETLGSFGWTFEAANRSEGYL